LAERRISCSTVRSPLMLRERMKSGCDPRKTAVVKSVSRT
jgi:hypothetical protein